MKIHTFLNEHGPVLLRRELPSAACTLARAARDGHLTTVLPGVYLASSLAEDPLWRIRALMRWNPNAIVTGVAAAHLTFWPELRIDEIDAACRATSRPGFNFSRRDIPVEFVASLGDIRLGRPALTAIDLIDSHGGDAIDRALRSRRVRLADLWHALEATPCRAGNTHRRRLLLDSRSEPWSAAERLSHRLLRAAGINGWKANSPVVVRGRCYYPDIAFSGIRLGIEIEGAFHDRDPAQAYSDRVRQNELVAAGWTILRFSYWMLVDDPAAFIDLIRSTMRRLSRAA